MSALQSQLPLYPEPSCAAERCFLVKCLGLVLKNSGSRNLVSSHLEKVEKVASASAAAGGGEVPRACAVAFGLCAVAYLDLALARLEEAAGELRKRQRGGFFRLLGDANRPPGEQQIR